MTSFRKLWPSVGWDQIGILHAGDIEQRREDVLDADRRVDACAGGSVTGPENEHRFAEASFVAGTLAEAQRAVLLVGVALLSVPPLSA